MPLNDPIRQRVTCPFDYWGSVIADGNVTEAIERAARRYRERKGIAPNTVQVNPRTGYQEPYSMVDDLILEVEYKDIPANQIRVYHRDHF